MGSEKQISQQRGVGACPQGGGVRTTIKDILDADLPVDPYPPELFDAKVAAIFDHVLTMTQIPVGRS